MNHLLAFGRMIKFSHSIFAMPFALASGLLAAQTHDTTWQQWALIVLCMVTARSAAMGFNRIVDRHIDAKNPRTAIREIPSGQIPLAAAVMFTAAAAAIFVAAAAILHPLCGWLSPVALLIVCGYSLGKRFTSLVHLWLGVALGLAPIAAWIAITGGIAATPLILAFAVATWVAGFDILYSLQDEEFDRGAGLRSIPAALGQGMAMNVSSLLHILTVLALAAVPFVEPLRWPYWVGVVAIAAVLAYEHHLVKPGDLSKIDKAFFDLNGYISLAFFVAVFAALP
ncbi:4-hydroxybenzoate octaprenyltransferase [Deltaproteobacteria bacterium]|nr:4-hydroxybenzoate octaprenyltransferase [Deltaproteobacteria bacterium]